MSYHGLGNVPCPSMKAKGTDKTNKTNAEFGEAGNNAEFFSKKG